MSITPLRSCTLLMRALTASVWSFLAAFKMLENLSAMPSDHCLYIGPPYW